MHQLSRPSDQRGSLIIPLALTIVTAIMLAGFAGWAYLNYTDQRDNVDEIVAAAVDKAKVEQKEKLQADFDEQSKRPFDTYTSPSSLGSIEINYPRTWSAYVETDIGRAEPLDAYFHPSYVPDGDTNYALRLLVNEREYNRVIRGYDNAIERGEVTTRPIKLSGETAQRFDGIIDKGIEGTVVIFPLRDKTVQIWTESTAYRADFEKIIEKLKFER